MQDEIFFRHSLMMLVLTFPSGVLADMLVMMAFCAVESNIFLVTPSPLLEIMMTAICGMAGYFQWFVALPWLCRWVWRMGARIFKG